MKAFWLREGSMKKTEGELDQRVDVGSLYLAFKDQSTSDTSEDEDVSGEDEEDLDQQVEALHERKTALEAKLEALVEKEKVLDAKEEVLIRSCCMNVQAERDIMEDIAFSYANMDAVQQNLDTLTSGSKIAKFFEIDYSGALGSISGLRMGVSEKNGPAWDEVNAAMGQAATLVYVMVDWIISNVRVSHSQRSLHLNAGCRRATESLEGISRPTRWWRKDRRPLCEVAPISHSFSHCIIILRT